MCIRDSSLTNFTLSTQYVSKGKHISILYCCEKVATTGNRASIIKTGEESILVLPCIGYIWKVIYSEYIALPPFSFTTEHL